MLVDANFDRVTEMSAAELRELAGHVAGRAGIGGQSCPPFRNTCRKNDAVENSAKYILGPQALLAVKAPLTAEQIDFSHEPEILMQDYTSKDGPLTLTLIEYPTPQNRRRSFACLAKRRASSSRLAAGATQRTAGRRGDWRDRQRRREDSAELGELRS